MSTLRRSRRTAAVTATSNLPVGQKGIQGLFPCVSKSTTVAVAASKEVLLDTQKTDITAIDAAAASKPDRPVQSTPQKRKLSEGEEGAGLEQNLPESKSARCNRTPSTPAKARRLGTSKIVDPRTPSKLITQSLRDIELRTTTNRSSKKENQDALVSPSTSPLSVRTPPPTEYRRYETPLSSECLPVVVPSPVRDSDSESSLPDSLVELIELHASLLTALSLHFTHNGWSAPADLRSLLPNIEKVWGKRSVTTRDIQRILGIMEQSAARRGLRICNACPIRLVNYGMGKVCIENIGLDKQRCDKIVTPFHEAELRADFIEELKEALGKQDKATKVDFDPNIFSISPIHASPGHLLNHQIGRSRLASLKKAAPASLSQRKLKFHSADQKNSLQLQATSDTKPGLSRSSSLLERIQSKQLAQSKLPPPPSKEDLVRRAAAQHIEDVVGVLSMLKPCGTGNLYGKIDFFSAVKVAAKAGRSGATSSFPLPTLVQILKDSLRTPVSKEEIEMCLDLLADDRVAKEWVSFVSVGNGGVRCVVLRGYARLPVETVKNRVRGLGLL